MAIDSIGSVSANASTLQASGIGQDDFMKILLTQLSFQDPLKPMDNQQFIAQMAQFTSLEQMRQLNEKSDSLLSIQSATQSIGLLGKTVGVETPSGSKVGTVKDITFASGFPQLVVDAGTAGVLTGVSLSQVTLVRP